MDNDQTEPFTHPILDNINNGKQTDNEQLREFFTNEFSRAFTYINGQGRYCAILPKRLEEVLRILRDRPGLGPEFMQFHHVLGRKPLELAELTITGEFSSIRLSRGCSYTEIRFTTNELELYSTGDWGNTGCHKYRTGRHSENTGTLST